MSTSVAVQLLRACSIWCSLVFASVVTPSGGTCCSSANSAHRELELQNTKFVAGRVLDEMELWSGPLSTSIYR